MSRRRPLVGLAALLAAAALLGAAAGAATGSAASLTVDAGVLDVPVVDLEAPPRSSR